MKPWGEKNDKNSTFLKCFTLYMLNVSGFYGFTLLYLDYHLHSLFFGCLDLNGPKKNVLKNLEVG